MIGNDVVDISQSRLESNWQRPGFIQKIFTDDEQRCITNTNDPEILIWLLWSMKEAAYKIYNRRTGSRRYIPKKFECTVLHKENTCCTGHVKCFGTLYYTRTIITQESLYTIAVTQMEHLDCVIEVEKKLILKNEYGIPYLYDNNTTIHRDVSVSNHGRFEKVATLKLDSQ